MHEVVSQMSVIPTPLTTFSVPVTEPMALWGVPCDQLTEEEKVKGLGTDVLDAMYLHTVLT